VVIEPVSDVTESGGVYVIDIDGRTALRRAWRVGSHIHVRPEVGGATALQAADVTVVGRVVLGGRWRDF
jgi:hypothetical protein